MKTKEFLKKHSACTGGAKWALSIGEEMADVWEALIREGRHEWLLWTAMLMLRRSASAHPQIRHLMGLLIENADFPEGIRGVK